jgi:hypothetical protein
MYQYSFISTTSDLLDAEEAVRTVRWARFPFRLLIILMGFLWMGAGIAAFDVSNPLGRPIVWLILGSGILYYFLVVPGLIRSKIRNNVDNGEMTVIGFDDAKIMININNVGCLVRRWDDFIGFNDSKKGIIFYFNDGIVNWLPNRVFLDKDKRVDFVKFLQEKQQGS